MAALRNAFWAWMPIALAAALGAPARPALAQERPPAARQALADLAYVLGESHALRQACRGPADQFWRDRMTRLLEVEAADQALSQRLRLTFNQGYAAGQASFPACDDKSRAEAARIAARGRSLSDQLAAP